MLDVNKTSAEFKKKYVLLKDVHLSKSYPQTLILVAIERQPLFRLRLENKFNYIDEDGIALPSLSKYSLLQIPDLVCDSLTITGNQISDQNLIRGIKIVSQLLKDSSLSIPKVVCEANGHFDATVNNVAIVFKPDQSPSEVLTSLQLLFDRFKIDGKWPEKIDLRFSKPVIVFD